MQAYNISRDDCTLTRNRFSLWDFDRGIWNRLKLSWTLNFLLYVDAVRGRSWQMEPKSVERWWHLDKLPTLQACAQRQGTDCFSQGRGERWPGCKIRWRDEAVFVQFDTQHWVSRRGPLFAAREPVTVQSMSKQKHRSTNPIGGLSVDSSSCFREFSVRLTACTQLDHIWICSLYLCCSLLMLFGWLVGLERDIVWQKKEKKGNKNCCVISFRRRGN